MTIDEAIRHAEKVADAHEEKIKLYAKLRTYEDLALFEHEETSCRSCAEEHRQLAEWLKDYKRLKEQEPKTGHWIYIGNGHNGLNKCSECGGERKMFDGLEKYCASCGAKMFEPQERNE